MKIGLVFGTRPEAIKFAPIYLECKKRNIKFKTILTGQHKEMLHNVLDLFNIKADYNLEIMKEGQNLSELTSRLIKKLDPIFKKEKFDYILVQGDTTSAFAGALCAFYNQIRVAHIEAGLRTGNLLSPFPEEANRKLIGNITNIHFAPTVETAFNLIKEGYNKDTIQIVGNTVIDALLWVKENKEEELKNYRNSLGIKDKYILLTLHRRENLGENMRNILKGIRFYLEDKDFYLVFPMHLNPKVREVVYEILGDFDKAILLEPQNYINFIALLDGCHYVMTDSGGIQEEAPSLGKPTLILRDTTERPEAIKAGTGKLIGTNKDNVIKYMELLEGNLYESMRKVENPYGQGISAGEIINILLGDKL